MFPAIDGDWELGIGDWGLGNGEVLDMLISELSKKTYLHDWHTAHHAKMPPFGGYDMPLWYASAKNEHLAVLRSAGLFDTSHMAVVRESNHFKCK